MSGALRVRRQSQQPGAADRSRLRPPDAARPLRGGRGVRLRLRVGRRQPLLEAPLRADLAAGRDLAAHVTREARHGLHGVVDAEPALSRARVGDARPDLGRPHDLRHGDGEPGGGCPARVRGARPRLRTARRALRRRPRRPARALDDGRSDVQGPVLRLRGRRLLLGHRDGPADAGAAPAADLGRLQPAAQGRRARRRDAAAARGGHAADPPLRRRLDDLLPRPAPRGARRPARVAAQGSGSSTTPTSTGSSSPTR